MSIISSNDVTIQLTHELDERGEYNAFTSLTAKILVDHGSSQNENAGSISAVIVHRQIIPERMFLSAMDGHSAEMQWLAVSLFEPRLGRTKLTSLRDHGDDDEFDFMYIESIHVDDRYKQDGNSDVGAYALRKLLHDPYVKGRAYENTGGDCWSVSSCIYILDPYDGMSKEVKERIKAEEESESESQLRAMSAMMRGDEEKPPETEESLRAKEEKEQMMDYYARRDANQFLRNGFYQDAAVARNRGNSPRIIVAAHGHWKQPLKSHDQAAAIQFYVGPPEIRPPLGKDSEILEVTKRMCTDCGMDGNASSRPGNDVATNQNRSSSYKAEVLRLIREGGSLPGSHALHAACALNDPTIVRSILQIDHTALESRDVHNAIPLMLAAVTAAGKSNKNGFPMDQPVIDTLVAAGARKGAVNSEGLTAYGLFKDQQKGYSQMMQAMMGGAVQSESSFEPGLAELEAKLMPPGGPTAADRTGGEGSELGFINYREEDSDYDSDCNQYGGDY
ncbi:hypothetical protein ACHAXR_004315 [Thalassiosira sp. AJA248-18]